MFVGRIIHVVGSVVEGVAKGALDGAQVLVKGGIATVTGTARVMANSLDEALASVYAEVKGAINRASAGEAEAKEEQDK